MRGKKNFPISREEKNVTKNDLDRGLRTHLNETFSVLEDERFVQSEPGPGTPASPSTDNNAQSPELDCSLID